MPEVGFGSSLLAEAVEENAVAAQLKVAKILVVAIQVLQGHDWRGLGVNGEPEPVRYWKSTKSR